ncbi:MAG: hypothetical protein KGH67_03940, partial [Candidatus Micrarchaeota archaeon]|nr:hypothetical protein [Candidatus Micrarchaeota archaeon]
MYNYSRVIATFLAFALVMAHPISAWYTSATPTTIYVYQTTYFPNNSLLQNPGPDFSQNASYYTYQWLYGTTPSNITEDIPNCGAFSTEGRYIPGNGPIYCRATSTWTGTYYIR